MKVVFTQISEKQGIKKLKERYVAAIVKEYKQLHEMNTFGIVCPEDLTPKYKRYVLREITSIKEKRYGSIKERSCVGGRAQR